MLENKNGITLWVVDVDGTMTDGGIYYDENGNELKKFCTKDAAGFFAARALGMKVMVLTGRECKATERRMKELKADYFYQNVKDKYLFLQQFLKEHDYRTQQTAYIGDDLNDLKAMQFCGYSGCPADGCREVKQAVDYISSVKGGQGAVRDIVEHFLTEQNLWKDAVGKIYGLSGR